MEDLINARMKQNYENAYRYYLPRRMPVILRLDGRAFRTFTSDLNKPFDDAMIDAMWKTSLFLCKEVSNAKIAYHQSDEISLLLVDYSTLDTQAWFDNNVQKMVTAAASMATQSFNDEMRKTYPNKTGYFDARVFVLPKEEVNNYFYGRQKDATKNSISAYGRHYFSHAQLEGLNGNQIQDKLFTEKGINFNDLPTYKKRGACALKIESDEKSLWKIDENIPIFSQNVDYINSLVYVG